MLTGSEVKVMKGSRVIFETLKTLGVDTVFGYPGGIVLDVYDELYNQTDIRHVLVRHEQSAVHAAEGYARTTGKCGVVLVTSGPGATNTVSGIVNAYLDGYPLVVLTGQVFKNLIGKDAFQEADICDITKSCTKKVFQISSASDIQKILTEAFYIANSGKKGPVVVDLVKDIFSQEVEIDFNVSNEIHKIQKQLNVFSEQSVKVLIDRLFQSKRPLIVSGGGVVHSNAEGDLLNFAKSLDIPVVDTMMGMGAFPQDDVSYFGMIGIFGDKAANQLVKDADLIISLGARFNDRITCMFKDVDLSSKFVQVDINEQENSRNIKAVDFICADIKTLLSHVNVKIASCELNFKKWLLEAQEYRALNLTRKKSSNMLHSFEVIRKIDDFTKGKKVLFTSEVGQHQLWAVQNLTFNENRRILVSGGSGTMGFGFPAAIGASVASLQNSAADLKYESVVCITGDGSFQMGLHELATCVDNNLDIKIVILNNGYLGMVRQLQEKFCDSHYSQTKISNPDFVKLAQSYGVKALRVSSISEVDKALEQAFNEKGPFILDFVVEPMELL